MNLICLLFDCEEEITKCDKEKVEMTCKRCLKKSVSYIMRNGHY